MSELFEIASAAFPYVAAVAILPTAFYALNFALSPPPSFSLWGNIAVGLASTALAFICASAMLSVVPIAWHYTKDWLHPFLLSPAAGVIFGVAAILLYRLRGKWPITYGVTEIYVGLATLAIVTQHETLVFEMRITSMFAAMYVIVRGLDNVARGLSPDVRSLWEVVFPLKVHVQYPLRASEGVSSG